MNIAPFKLERFFAKYEFTAPYLMCSSDCESVSVGDLLALEPGSDRQLEQLWLGYTEAPGHLDLRREIAVLYNQIDAAQVLVHAGAEEAIFNFVQALLSPGDHVIVHTPCYQSLFEVARAAGCEVTRWPTSAANGWALDLDFLADHIRPATKAVIINAPHNPTGYLPDPATQQQLVELARRHNLLLFSDEVYRGLEYDPADRLPAACDLYENAVSLGVMSKTYGLAGLRIGWIATRNPEVYRHMAAFKDYTSICNSAPSEFLATLALRQREQLAARNLGIIRYNLALLNQFFAAYPQMFEWQPPRAGAIAFPRLLLPADIESFCIDLVEQAGVLLLPGNYYDDPNNHFRVGFGRKNMEQALGRLNDFLQRYHI